MATTLGLDIGPRAVTAVAIRGGLRSREISGVVRVPLDERDGDGANGDALRGALGEVTARTGSGRDGVVAALASDRVSIVFLDFPFSERRVDEGIVRSEVEPHIPGAVDDYLVSWCGADGPSDPTGSRVASALVRQDELGEHLARLEGAGIDPRIVDVDLLALYTCGASLPAPERVRAFVDLGAERSLLVVLVGDRLRHARSLPIGSDRITSRVRDALGVDEAQAHELWTQHADAVGVSGGVDPDAPPHVRAIADAVATGYDEIFREITTTLRMIERRDALDVGRLYLTGAAARPEGVDELGNRRTGLATVVAPLPAAAAGRETLAEHWPDAAVAYGLALRGQRPPAGSGINFRCGPFAYQAERGTLRTLVAPFALPALAVLLTGCLSLGIRYAHLRYEADRVRQAEYDIFIGRFPSEPIVDPEAQFRQKIGALRSEIDLLGGSLSPADVLRATSEAVPEDLQVVLDGLQFEPERSTIRGRAPSYESIESLKSSLAGVELFSSVRVAEQQKDGAEVSFRIVLDHAHAGGAS